VAKRTLRRQTPKVGARCGNTARRDLCGGRAVTRVPTAICRKAMHAEHADGDGPLALPAAYVDKRVPTGHVVHGLSVAPERLRASACILSHTAVPQVSR